MDSLKLLKMALRHPQASFDVLRTLTPCTHILKGPERDGKGARQALTAPVASRILELHCSLEPQRLLPAFWENARDLECIPLTGTAAAAEIRGLCTA